MISLEDPPDQPEHILGSPTRHYLGTTRQQRRANSPRNILSSPAKHPASSSTAAADVGGGRADAYSNYNGFRELSTDEAGRSVLDQQTVDDILFSPGKSISTVQLSPTRRGAGTATQPFPLPLSHQKLIVGRENVVELARRCTTELAAKVQEKRTLEVAVKRMRRELEENKRAAGRLEMKVGGCPRYGLCPRST